MQALIFTLLKYVEIGITAISMLIVARVIGPEQMGVLMPIFLFITYSNYLNLGSSQLVLKYLSIESKETNAVIDVAVKILFFSITAVLVIAWLLLDNQFSLRVGIVSCCILTRSVMIANLRAKNKYRKININNIAVSLIMLTGSLFFVLNVTDFVWLLLIVNVSSLLLYIFSDLSFTRRAIYSMRSNIRIDAFRFYLIVAIKLSVIGLFTTLLLTLDKLVLQMFDFTKTQYGIYQLSDNIANLIYVGLSALLFFMYPILLVKIKNSKVYLKRYLNAQLFFFPVCLVGLILLWCVGFYIELVIFPEFTGLSNILVYSIAYKISVFQLSLMSVVFISRDNETYMIKVCLLTMVLIILFVFLGVVFFHIREMHEILLSAIVAINLSYIYEFFKEKKQAGNRLFQWEEH
ncbi:hypothetical protein NM09_18630 [Vibrio caribbeanicus]|uniref:Uncharacterized protein n=1 Tax=Vibrio caribbeanicus TaxID=701175 RepID=A0ACC4NSM1_9VIBR|nr:hypothetical protein NM09_18630 [Vibrio caribbeanicus]